MTSFLQQVIATISNSSEAKTLKAVFYKEEFTGQGEGRNQDQKTRRISSSTHTVTSTKDVFAASRLSSLKRKLQLCLSKETRLKKQKPFRPSHCLLLWWAGACWGNWGQQLVSGKERTQTAQQNIPGTARRGRKATFLPDRALSSKHIP